MRASQSVRLHMCMKINHVRRVWRGRYLQREWLPERGPPTRHRSSHEDVATQILSYSSARRNQ